MIASRRVRLRRVLRDLSAASAFAAIALSGSVPAWALIGFTIALGLSLTNRRPLSGRTAWSVIVLLFLAALMGFAVFRGGLDPIVAACSFAALVTGHRMISDPLPGTDQQVHLTSLLMIAGGAALSGELWFAVCLGLFGVTASISLGLGVLEGPTVDEGDVPITPAVRQLSLGVALALTGGVLFFVFFPRLSWNFAPRRQTPGLGGTTGMSDSVRLGGGGSIKSSPRVVLRARLEPDPGDDKLEQYWVGRTFDTFDGKEWRGRGKEGPPLPQARVLKRASLNKSIQQTIEILPAYGARTLVGLDTVVRYMNAQALTTSGSNRTALVMLEDEEVHFADGANGYTYQASSLRPRDVPTAQALEDPERFLQLPDSVKNDPRVAALATDYVGDRTGALAAGRAIEGKLRSGYGYSLDQGDPTDNPLTEFLFDRKQGHCEHFATATAVLLRSAGHPSRVVAGFFGGERVGDKYVVRAGDAHAWTQVFDPATGWVTLDATPDSGRGSQPLAFFAWVSTRYEELEALWRARVVDYSFQDQIDLARSLVRPPVKPAGPDTPGLSLPPRAAWITAALIGLGVYSVWRLSNRRRTSRPHPMASFLDQIDARLESAGIVRLDEEPIEAVCARLSSAGHPLATPLREVVRLYLSARFGGAPALTPQERSSLLSRLTKG